ncbi:uncharacterized protein TRUGW13939_11853 [Talaromyces rugulosus]|uniref:VOC domain-containing protein n=1 Tax=Talaromyces rugulosus TaxID=121627 RepID=A0A7H8REZ4_TALRU|nr:uncharacterized protein TRUGW13939_11853 [Talaromyces rugulosus]QKX64677.1 hypothetical protein TRUGW13939_11853 [Talaromyces rugulosus]
MSNPHPSPISLAHVVLRTTPANYPKMVSFYVSLLSATPIYQNDSMTFLRYDDEHHRIAIIQTPDVNPSPENTLIAGLDHIAFAFATLTSLAQTYISLKSATPEPIVPLWCVNHGPTTSMYYRDPNGARVELQVDNFDTAEEADAFMRSAAFAKNSIGTDFEPEEWAALILSKVGLGGEEGLSLEEVKRLKTRSEVGGRRVPPDYQ